MSMNKSYKPFLINSAKLVSLVTTIPLGIAESIDENTEKTGISCKRVI